MAEGRLFVCSTPIGNLGDVSDRLREVLSSSDVVYAEDTRRTSKLLAHIGVSKQTRSLFVGNERARTDELLSNLGEGMRVALVTDAGMPSISDPGALAVALAREQGHHVDVIPGPSAVTTAVALAGYGGDRFAFDGFLPRKGAARRARIGAIQDEERIVVLFASPNRLADDLRDLAGEDHGDRMVTVLREMTKVHQEVWSGTLAEAVSHWEGRDVRGEVTLVLDAIPEQVPPDIDAAILHARDLIESGASPSDAARRAAEETGARRREIYQRLIDQEPS